MKVDRALELADDIDVLLAGLDKSRGDEFKAGLKTLGEMMYVRGQEISAALRALAQPEPLPVTAMGGGDA